MDLILDLRLTASALELYETVFLHALRAPHMAIQPNLTVMRRFVLHLFHQSKGNANFTLPALAVTRMCTSEHVPLYPMQGFHQG